MIEIVEPGLLTTIQDQGRRGYESYGMPPSGAFDPFLASVANKLVGNTADCALLEFALVGPTLRFLRDCWVAITGMSISYRLKTETAPLFAAFRVPKGEILQFGEMKSWFGYLAFAGGIRTEKVLGSASAYLAGGISERMRKNDRLVVGSATNRYYAWQGEFEDLRTMNVIRILQAVHTPLFEDREKKKLAEGDYRISIQSNRMGIHLEGASIEQPRVRRSAPMLPGSIQIPRSGRPLILGPEGPTVGGYPQIAIISRTAWTNLAVSLPGQNIRFEWISDEEARRIRSLRSRLLESEDSWERVG